MRVRREVRVLAATAALAVGVPVAAGAWVAARSEALAAQLTRAGGVPARIGGVDADLTGAIRLTDVGFGALVSADAVEASVAMGSLLGGQLRADEIRVDRPQVAVRIEPGGDSDLARLARTLLARSGGDRAPGGGERARRLRRIVVDRGSLTARIAGVGELTAAGVELIPAPGGARLVTGPISLRATGPRDTAADLRFARSAAELSLPRLQFGRVLAVGGAGHVRIAGEALALRELSAGRLSPDGPLALRTELDDDGVARTLAIDLDADLQALAVRGDHVPLRALAGLAPAGLDLRAARASGALAVRRRGTEIAIALDGAIEGAVIDHRTIAAAPVALAGAVRGELSVSPGAIAVTRAQLEVGAARLAAHGWWRRTAPMSGQLELTLAEAPCRDLVDALPAALRGPLDGIALTGQAGARGKLVVDLAAPPGDGAHLTGELLGRCEVAAEPPAADVRTLVEAGEQQLADGSRRRVGRGEADYVELGALPVHVRGAFVSAEDGRFWDHPGFDVQQIARSLEIDLREARLARGGSTISQQLIKNAFLSQRRSLDRKLQEAVLTWRLEAVLTKRQILERYLNIIELGPHVFGLSAAARHWFATTPANLSVRQAAFLAALTSQPTSMSRRVRRAGALDEESAERVAVVLRAMKRDRVIDATTYDISRYAPMGFAD